MAALGASARVMPAACLPSYTQDHKGAGWWGRMRQPGVTCLNALLETWASCCDWPCIGWLMLLPAPPSGRLLAGLGVSLRPRSAGRAATDAMWQMANALPPEKFSAHVHIPPSPPRAAVHLLVHSRCSDVYVGGYYTKLSR